jgi:hypothetical protein
MNQDKAEYESQKVIDGLLLLSKHLNQIHKGKIIPTTQYKKNNYNLLLRPVPYTFYVPEEMILSHIVIWIDSGISQSMSFLRLKSINECSPLP